MGRAGRLAAGSRRILGITGPPGAGKSTLARRLVDAVAGAVLVPMDGFHLTGSELDRLGRRRRKGAPDTFDADGYVALLEGLRHDPLAVARAPTFDRERDEPRPDAITVEPGATLVVTEGNYLLLPRPPWDRIRPLLDECWYVDTDDEVRRWRLTARHIRHGRSPEAADAWVREVDEPNAGLVRTTRDSADLVVSDRAVTSP